ncbi:hypothetical protein KY309_02845 [Candidatus Woesearchaeota archaeon]|nr:hypothetical protein [Candidatus Woesearchaeota archaeon]
MKTMWILAAILILILAACAPKEMPKEETQPEAPVEKAPVTTETPPPKEPEVKTQPPVETLPSERTATAPPPEPVVKEEMSPQLKSLLKRADDKITSGLEHLYGGTSTKNLFLDTYYLLDGKMKIKKYEEDFYVREGYYDTVYVDLGIGCCEERSRCQSHNIDNTVQKFEVDAQMLNIPKTPIQWTKEIPASAVIVGPQTFNERTVTYIKFDKDGAQYEMWVDDTYGVPHKVLITSGGDTIKHQFNDMKFNNLRENDFNPPCD